VEQKEVRVFIVPRTAEDASGEVKTALRLAMDSAGLSLRALEARSGVSRPTIGNLANGKGGVDKKKAVAISEALGLKVWNLFEHGDSAEVA
jgi:transcriptional regulator with XRE-family HTH domain